MYLSVYLFKNKPTGPHKVDFITENRRDKLQIPCPTREGAVREGGGGLITKTDFQTY